MRRLVLLAAAWLAAGAAFAAEPVRRMPFSVPVAIAADGTAEVGAIEGLPEAVGDVVRTALRDLPYVVATREGRPVASTVQVDGDALLLPRGEEFEVAIEHLETQPRLLAWRPADYPIEMMRERTDGSVSLVLDVGADGRVAHSTLVGSGNADFARAVRDAVADWRFETPVAGERFQVGATFWFHGNWAPSDPPVVPCTVAPQAAHLPGDDGCLRVSETTGGIYRRGEQPRNLNLLGSPAPPSAIAQGAGAR